MHKEDIRVAIFGGIGWICLGMGLYGIYAEGEPFHPAFNNQDFINALLLLGGVLVVIEIKHFARKILNHVKTHVDNQ